MKINKQYRSPNFNDRNGKEISAIVIHFTEIDFAASLERLCDPVAEVSAHYLISKNGDIYNLVDEKYRAWHAGESFWHRENVNNFSIGIELDNNGAELYPDIQIRMLIDLCKVLISKYKISPLNIVGHSDIAPTRKVDPGVLFPWKNLADNGIGLMPTSLLKQKLYQKGDYTQQDLKNHLDLLGYHTFSQQQFEKSIEAFATHFLPDYLYTGAGLDKEDISYIIGAIRELI